MQTILILGAGRSAKFLIEYLAEWSLKTGNKLIVSDQTAPAVGLPISAEFRNLQLSDREASRNIISEANMVISMLPAFMHPEIARICCELGKNMATASYESDEMRSLKPLIEKKGLFFLNECGLDPGLDHMSAMKIIHKLTEKGAKISGFESYCGGLIERGKGDNPWGYKFSWNPRNVILAGQGTAKFLKEGELCFLPYHRLFRSTNNICLPNGEMFDGYINRDSLQYREIYGLDNVKDLCRGTLRYPRYCEAWDIFVQMGITDDSYLFPIREHMSYLEFAKAFLPGTGNDFSKRIDLLAGNNTYTDQAKKMVFWTGLFSNEPILLKEGSPASILQDLLERKWKLEADDRDRVIMVHKIHYEFQGKAKTLESSLEISGTDPKNTAMAKTVGLPLAIAASMFLEGKLASKGLQVPVHKEFYEPILKELESRFGICFHEKEHERDSE